jgi:2-(1,2-epoxy-1,2-dihydrophenyl)acetyl-CoA isomerase
VMLGERQTARDALALGLVNQVVPDADLDARALELAARLAEAPTAAAGIAKRLINRGADMDRLDAHLDAELAELARIADGPNFAEGLAAFLERRPPRFGAE